MFVVSDFISARLGTDAGYPPNATKCWRCASTSEVELPDVGPMSMENAETGEQLYVDTHDPRFRARFAEALATENRR